MSGKPEQLGFDYGESTFEEKLDFILKEIREGLVQKNQKYGDSLTSPLKIFYKGDTVDGIYARLDDKLARLRHQSPKEDEDVETDLIGYLLLLKLYKKFK